METTTAPQASQPVVTSEQAPAKIGLRLLVALVVGALIGSGIFGLPQNMAAGAGAGAILIGWGITGMGMLALALVYQMIALRMPHLDNGVYAYARASAGEYVGFNSAWGYWVSAWVGNVGYLVAAFSAVGYFFPSFGEGNTATSVMAASVVLWVVHMLVLKGIKGAMVLNAVVTAAKLVPLLLFIVFVALAFNMGTVTLNFWGDTSLGTVLDQVKSTMLVTVWVFIGVEGASVYSARAKRREDVGRATIIGFVITLLLLMAVSLLSLGVLNQPELAGLKNPSMAGVLEKAVGWWGAVLIYAGLIVSVGGGFLAWTLLAAESLFTPACDGVMPKALARLNTRHVPGNAMWLTSSMVQIFLLVTLFSKASYLALISLSTAMILLPYLFSAVYGLILAWRRQGTPDTLRALDLPVTLFATLYCGWLLYAAGPRYLFLSSLLYAPGALIYGLAKREQGARVFQGFELALFIVLVALAVLAIFLLSTGRLDL
ncbi:arginine-ornithine antiporter [Nitratidesulfovibrio sp.]|uniref:arginine-ornithine antiporter n=1 Tax=Nitratidesulfovibrio sp. TaxID=2802297 RepID=UPI003340091A